MGLKPLIARQVQGAMRILGTTPDGLAAQRTLVSVSPGAVYDFDTRTYVSVETTYTGIPMTFVRFKIEDMDDSVKPKTDRRALIASLDLPVPATEKDYVIDEAGARWEVQRLLSDPADALVILHIRKV